MDDEYFDHEKLRVYQDAVNFVVWCDGILSGVPVRTAVKDQLDRASTSIPLNVAEGNGRYSPRERAHYFNIARSSGLECAACLDVLAAKGLLDRDTARTGKRMLLAIVSMLTGLIQRNSDRVSEERVPYEADSPEVSARNS